MRPTLDRAIQAPATWRLPPGFASVLPVDRQTAMVMAARMGATAALPDPFPAVRADPRRDELLDMIWLHTLATHRSKLEPAFLALFEGVLIDIVLRLPDGVHDRQRARLGDFPAHCGDVLGPGRAPTG